GKRYPEFITIPKALNIGGIIEYVTIPTPTMYHNHFLFAFLVKRDRIGIARYIEIITGKNQYTSIVSCVRSELITFSTVSSSSYFPLHTAYTNTITLQIRKGTNTRDNRFLKNVRVS